MHPAPVGPRGDLWVWLTPILGDPMDPGQCWVLPLLSERTEFWWLWVIKEKPSPKLCHVSHGGSSCVPHTGVGVVALEGLCSLRPSPPQPRVGADGWKQCVNLLRGQQRVGGEPCPVLSILVAQRQRMGSVEGAKVKRHLRTDGLGTNGRGFGAAFREASSSCARLERIGGRSCSIHWGLCADCGGCVHIMGPFLAVPLGCCPTHLPGAGQLWSPALKGPCEQQGGWRWGSTAWPPHASYALTEPCMPTSSHALPHPQMHTHVGRGRAELGVGFLEVEQSPGWCWELLGSSES